MSPDAQKKPISFREWQQALAASGESPSRQRIFREEIMGFLRQCELWHSPASVELAKQYLAARPTQDGNDVRDALRWFVRAARKAADSNDETDVTDRTDAAGDFAVHGCGGPCAKAPAFARRATADRRGYAEAAKAEGMKGEDPLAHARGYEAKARGYTRRRRAQPFDALRALTHSTPLRVILSLSNG